MTVMRLTQYARGGGCACKLPPGVLESVVGVLRENAASEAGDGLLVGPETGDDAAVTRLSETTALVSTADFFTPVVDDAFDWGRIAAANALSDVYAMGGTPLVGINLLSWPMETLPLELAKEVLRGGQQTSIQAACHVGGGHSVDDDGPKFGMAVTGTVHLSELMRNSTGTEGLPLTLTKPLGVGVLNTRHKQTGEVFPEAVETMAALNKDAALAAVSAGIVCATDVTGFGLLGHLMKLARASGVTAVLDSHSVPYLDGARDSARKGFVSGGSRRNLEWVLPHTAASSVSVDELLLLADAQTSGGLLLAGEIPGEPVIGHLASRQDAALIVR